MATYGAALGMIGGALGMLIGDHVSFWLRGLFGGNLVIAMLARGLGWSLLGMAIGMSEGFAARSLGKFSYGTLGGAIGGFIGGAMFELFYGEARRSGTTEYFWNAMGLVILGACIGSLSALVQAVFQPANVRVLPNVPRGRTWCR